MRLSHHRNKAIINIKKHKISTYDLLLNVCVKEAYSKLITIVSLFLLSKHVPCPFVDKIKVINIRISILKLFFNIKKNVKQPQKIRSIFIQFKSNENSLNINFLRIKKHLTIS